MNSFDSVCVEELSGYSDYLAMQELQLAYADGFGEWIESTSPTVEELDAWFEENFAGKD